MIEPKIDPIFGQGEKEKELDLDQDEARNNFRHRLDLSHRRRRLRDHHRYCFGDRFGLRLVFLVFSPLAAQL